MGTLNEESVLEGTSTPKENKWQYQSHKPTPTITQSLFPMGGLVAGVAQFIYDQAPLPNEAVALWGAITFCAGVTGRAYNVNGASLAQYLLLTGGTGMGKEAGATGNAKLIKAMVDAGQTSTVKRVGPTSYASGQSLLRCTTRQACFYSILSEFGFTLRDMCAPRASSHQQELKRVLLELYSKGGYGNVLGARVHAKGEDNTVPVDWPAVTIAGEGTPHSLFENFDPRIVEEGLLPRFLFFEIKGLRGKLNKGFDKVLPPVELVQKLCELEAQAQAIEGKRTVCNVGMTPQAEAAFDADANYCTNYINAADSTNIGKELFNRANLKALKLGALIAVGINPFNPVIDINTANGSIELVRLQTKSLIEKFASGQTGEISTNESARRTAIIKTVKHYMEAPFSELKKYGANEWLHKKQIITQTYLHRKLCNTAAFRNAPGGATNALKLQLHNMTDAAELQQVSKQQMHAEFDIMPVAYKVINEGVFVFPDNF